MKNNVNVQKAFTLVELIVVITILAILGTIAFLSMQGYSADARNSKRVSDLNSISNAVSVGITNGTSIIAYVNDSTSALTGALANIAGTGVVVGTDYNAGPVNYGSLGIKQDDFQDPSSNTPYVLGVTVNIGGKYEVASIKEAGTTKSAMVLGNYVPRKSTDDVVTGLSALSGSGTETLTLGSSDLNKLFLGDTIVAGTATGKITIVSADLSKITFDTGATSTGVKLATAESTGLIGAVGAPTTPVINAGPDLPYSVN